jgi:hypothetical protein
MSFENWKKAYEFFDKNAENQATISLNLLRPLYEINPAHATIIRNDICGYLNTIAMLQAELEKIRSEKNLC